MEHRSAIIFLHSRLELAALAQCNLIFETVLLEMHVKALHLIDPVTVGD